MHLTVGEVTETGPCKVYQQCKDNAHTMTTTYQRNILSTEYNGWENYETWNVALWINNDEGLYNIAMEAGDYQTFCDYVGSNATTGDGVKYNDPKVNVIQLNSDVFDL